MPRKKALASTCVTCIVIFGAMLSTVERASFVEAASALPATGQTILSSDAPTCWALDVVLLIDQSYSMFATEDANTGQPLVPSDPDNYRYQAAKDILDKLIDNRLSVCPLALHRIAILAFGDKTESALSTAEVMTQVNLSPSASDEERDTWSRGYFQLIDEASTDNTQNYTDPQQAFVKADAILGAAPVIEEPEGYGPRRQIIILVTDGYPTGRVANGRTVAIGTAGIPQYMCDLAADLNMESYDARSIWIVAMNGGEAQDRRYLNVGGCDGQSLENNLSVIAEAHRGRLLTPLYNATALQQTLNLIVLAEFGQSGEPIQCGDVFFVEPYLQQIKFTFFRPTPASPKVVLSKLDETNNPVYTVFDEVETTLNPAALGDMTLNLELSTSRRNVEEIVFDLPAPGNWRFDVQGLSREDCQRSYQSTKVRAVAEAVMSNPALFQFLPQEFEAPYYDTGGPIPFVVRLKSSAGSTLQQDPRYPLTVWAHLQLPPDSDELPADFAGVPDVFELGYSEANQEWTSEFANVSRSVYAVAPLPGVYSLVITGTASMGNGQPDYQAFVQSLTYQVKKLERFSFAITSPEPDAVLTCNEVKGGDRVNVSVPVSVLVTGDGGAESSNYINTDLAQAFEARALNPSGQLLGQPVFLQPQGTSGQFTGTLLTQDDSGATCGQVKIQVSFVGGFDGNLYSISQGKKTVETGVTRQLVSGVRLVPVSPASEALALLHPDLRAACPGGAGIQPVQLEFRLEDLSQKSIDPARVGDVASLYAVRLVNSTGNQWEDLTLTSVSSADGTSHLWATGGLSVTAPGDYYFEIMPRPEAFAVGYVPVEEDPVRINFVRQDELWTRPSTCTAALSVSGALVVGLVALIVYLLSGGPGGSLALVETGDPGNTLAGPFRLSTVRFPPPVKHRLLLEMGIAAIRYRRAGNKASPAVHLEVIGSSGSTESSYVLQEGEDNAMPLGTGDIVYYRGGNTAQH